MTAVRRMLAALTLVAALGLAGCATIPTSGGVGSGTPQNADAPGVVLVPNPPVQGANQTQIVEGFVTAATGQQNNYSVARKFLTPALAKTWQPNARVLIHDDALHFVQPSDTAVTMTVPTTATVSASGEYVQAPPATTTVVRFQLVKVGGEWRIAKTPDGIVLGEDYFTHVFSNRSVSYFDPGFTRKVPDLRWFPASPLRPEDVVRALLAGAAEPIAVPVTATAFPAGTTLAGPVQLVGNVAGVPLHMSGSLPSALTLQRMQWQLTDSLKNLDGITQVQMTVNGRSISAKPLTLPPAEGDPRPLILRGGTFGYLAGGSVTTEPRIGNAVAALRPTAVTTDVQRGMAAVLTAGGVAVVTGSGHRMVDTRPNLVAPTLDQNGWVYSVPKSDWSGLRAFDGKGDGVDISLGLPAAGAVVAIEVSPDGTRMLVLLQADDGPHAFVAGIIHGPGGVPQALTTAVYPVDVPAGTALDATWVDPGSVAVLTAGQDGDQVTLQPLGGYSSSLGRLQNGQALVGFTKQSDLRALLSNGDIAVLRSGAWQATEPSAHASVLAVQR